MSLMATIVWISVDSTILDLGLRICNWPRLKGRPTPSPSAHPSPLAITPSSRRLSRPGEDPTHALWRTVSRVENSGLTSQRGEVAAQSAQILYPLVDLIDAKIDQLGDMGTRSFASVSDTEHFSQLGQGQAHCLTCSNEGQPVDHRRVILPITRGCPVGLG